MNVRAFLFESAYQLITWVFIGASIAGICYFSSKTNWRGAMWALVILITSIVVMLGLLADRYVVAEHIRFSVAAETGIRTTYRAETPSATFWVVFSNGNEIAMAPITNCIYVRFTNDDPKPIMIDYYAVDIRSPSGTWHKTSSLDRKIGQLVMTTASTTKGTAMDITLDEPTFDRVVKDVSIISGGTVKGWLLIERPIGFDGITEWRLRIRDINGRQGAAIIAAAPSVSPKFTETLSSVGFRTAEGPPRDITQFHVMYYSDLLKRTGNDP